MLQMQIQQDDIAAGSRSVNEVCSEKRSLKWRKALRLLHKRRSAFHCNRSVAICVLIYPGSAVYSQRSTISTKPKINATWKLKNHRRYPYQGKNPKKRQKHWTSWISFTHWRSTLKRICDLNLVLMHIRFKKSTWYSSNLFTPFKPQKGKDCSAWCVRCASRLERIMLR